MIKILFVDDESNLLDGLKRMLRRKRDVWDMDFVKSGPDALKQMEKNYYRIVVSDYKMPEMDGLELLRQVKERYKDSRRIILSGQSESEVFHRAKEVAHAYVTKPCDPEELILVIEQNI